MKKYFFGIFFIIFLLTFILAIYWPPILWSLILTLPLFLIGIYDLLQRRHTVWRNFPLIGHLRYLFEAVRPEIQQYFIEPDWGGRPMNRMQREIVYARAKGDLATLPYGTHEDINAAGYEWLVHSCCVEACMNEDLRVMVGNEQCQQPYSASILNISAMSFGSLSKNAILALNRGAQLGNFYHNTGEGGLSRYHLKYGGDLVWQIGTAYFSCRTKDGKFSPELFQENALLPNVKMIELKISQGAKPSYGGILPAVKLTKEIAELRGVELGQAVISPSRHQTFSTPIQFLEFIATLRELSGGKPTGFKICIGSQKDFFSICRAMVETKIYPDFITIDGGEGGTGAAPLEFANAVGTPIADALPFVHNVLVGVGLRDKIRIIGAGKIATGFDVVSKLVRGADICNSARAMMLALGCIQSLRCNTNRCPTGVTTQAPGLVYGLVVEDKYKRIKKYHHATVRSVCDLVAAAGLASVEQLDFKHIKRRVNGTVIKTLDEIYPMLGEGDLLTGKIPEIYREVWEAAKPSKF